MNVVVLVKPVPDTEYERRLDPADKTVDRTSAAMVINYIDEFAIEEGVRLKETHGGTVTVLTVAPEHATDSIRKALSRGADQAVHVSDEALHGSDVMATARVVARALGTLDWDVVIAGSEATDSRSAVLPALLAEALGVAQLSLARKLTVDGSMMTIERVTADGAELVSGSMPAVVSVVEKINEPRYPSFKSIMAAKSRPVRKVMLDDLEIATGEVGLAGAWSEVVSFEHAPARQAGVLVEDGGDGGAKISDYLATKHLI